MYFNKINKERKEKLFEELRKVPLLKNSKVHLYENATFEIKVADPADYHPSAFYILKRNLTNISVLTKVLVKEVGSLDTLIEYQDKSGIFWRMIPPIVELADFKKWMVLDGAHRCYNAIMNNEKIPMLFVSNVGAPYLCLPLPKKWESVKILEKVPSNRDKRIFRPGINDSDETRYDLHRNLGQFGSLGNRTPNSK